MFILYMKILIYLQEPEKKVFGPESAPLNGVFSCLSKGRINFVRSRFAPHNDGAGFKIGKP